METNTQKPANDLKPPKDAHLSVVLNGIGNGMMLGALPLVGAEFYSMATKKPLPEFARIAGVVGSVVGAVFGGMLGNKEYHNLNVYQQRVASEITALRTQVNSLQASNTQWQERVSASPTAMNERS
jgi:hypothetical protein